MPTLLTTTDIGRRLGVSREWARRLAERDDFPAPVHHHGRARLWSETDIEDWIAEHRSEDAAHPAEQAPSDTR